MTSIVSAFTTLAKKANKSRLSLKALVEAIVAFTEKMSGDGEPLGAAIRTACEKGGVKGTTIHAFYEELSDVLSEDCRFENLAEFLCFSSFCTAVRFSDQSDFPCDEAEFIRFILQRIRIVGGLVHLPEGIKAVLREFQECSHDVYFEDGEYDSKMKKGPSEEEIQKNVDRVHVQRYMAAELFLSTLAKEFLGEAIPPSDAALQLLQLENMRKRKREEDQEDSSSEEEEEDSDEEEDSRTE